MEPPINEHIVHTETGSEVLGNGPYCGGRAEGVSLWLRGRLAFCLWFYVLHVHRMIRGN
jgi:hypothetical protein